MFKVIKKAADSNARIGVIETSHGSFETPVFMVVGTQGTVKALTHKMTLETGCEVVISNNYYLNLRPGLDVIKKAGGLHKFIAWERPILTDSGGYQVFSMSELVKVKDEGAEFTSPLNGDKIFFTPASVIQSQSIIGSDIMMVLDECIAYPHTRQKAYSAMKRTLKWAEDGLKEFVQWYKDYGFEQRVKIE